MSEFMDKVGKIRSLLEDKGLSAAVIRRNPNLAWLISGRVHVPTTIDMACFDIVITKDQVFAVTNAIEAPRLAAEEFPSGLDITVINWWEGRDAYLPTGPEVGCDQAGGDRTDLGGEIELLRQQLTEFEVTKFRTLCIDAAVSLGSALRGVSAEDRELDVAGAISNALWKKGMDLAFLGVAGAERVHKFRHPLPTESLVGNRVVASICARRKGLIASVTRIVTFGEVSTNEVHEYEDLLHVEAALLGATIVGNLFSDPINAAITAYPTHHFETDEWHHHHQGGPSGFLPRDWPATPTSSRVILDNQIIAWNPTGKGWKVEDTLVTGKTGIEILSNDPNWPSCTVAGRARPLFLKR